MGAPTSRSAKEIKRVQADLEVGAPRLHYREFATDSLGAHLFRLIQLQIRNVPWKGVCSYHLMKTGEMYNEELVFARK